ncbi:hypothetical protein F7Q99_31865 [Streptomyces kaniharaensis]|uniref:Uncharacterized protein n=1 Tax=Streptomyces kaniharaensis TaxID=212423 RepID=A0A6N7KYF5_9ACTN|nr:hypothetical protein [Streptomyces kaniharaensis]MQS16662.1 hypothetical protein [Streptomyces kaniharaensis]
MAVFTNRRSITSADSLTPVQAEQVALSGTLYDGEDLPAERRLSADGDDEAVLNLCELWDVVADGVPLYEAWFYQVDSGSIFLAGTTEVVAEIIQCGLECSDPERRLELGAAMVRAGLLPASDSAYQEFREATGDAPA